MRGVPFSNERYTKGVPFLKKMVCTPVSLNGTSVSLNITQVSLFTVSSQ